MSSENKIRVAVLTRGDSLESWEINALQAVKDLPFAELVLEIRDGTPAIKKTFGQRLVQYKWSRLFWNRWFKKYGKTEATQEHSTASIFNNVARIEVVPELKGKFSQHFSSADIARVKEHKPDVIIRFGFNILRGEILNVPPQGVWSYHHADHEVIRGGPAGFWEYLLGEYHTGAILQRLTEKLDDGIVLRRGYWALVKHSFRENLDTLLMNSSGWIANAITEIHLHGSIKPQNSDRKINSKVYSYPGNFRMIMFWNVLIGNKIAFHWNNLFSPETWKLGVVDQTIQDITENGIHQSIRWVSAPKTDSYYADPFSFIDEGGKREILCEYFCGIEQRSRIVNPETNLDVYHPATHVSFPNVIVINGDRYLLPEASASGKCSLIRLDASRSEIVLRKEPIVDPVLFQHNGLWWLLGHRSDNQNNAALFAYYSELPTEEFHPHPLNPVKTDIRNSRAAGEVFMKNGKLIRPAQDSALTYGHAIVLNEILTLTPDSFEERAVKRINANPDWEYNNGIHTINAYGSKTLIDAKSFRFNFANFKAQFSRKARRITGK